MRSREPLDAPATKAARREEVSNLDLEVSEEPAEVLNEYGQEESSLDEARTQQAKEEEMKSLQSFGVYEEVPQSQANVHQILPTA